MGTLEQRKKDIIGLLNDDGVHTIFLVGDAGMGKTWMAREICESLDEDLWYETTFWVYVTEKYQDTNLFYKDIARQLSLSSTTEKWGYEEENTDQEEEGEEIGIISKEKIKIKRVQEKLREIGLELSQETKYLLLVLDGEGHSFINNGLHEKLSQEWVSMFPSMFQNRLKIITTTRESGGSNADQQTSKVVKMERHQLGESLILLQNRVDKMVSDKESFRQLDQAIAEKSKGMPAAVIVIAEALNYIARYDASNLERAIVKAAYYEKSTSWGVNPLFYCASDDLIKSSTTKNCLWHSMHLFRYYGGVHYNELITHWIIEGYFDPFDHIEEAYQEGHGVLMELIDRALLKIQENNIVAVEGAALNMTDYCPLQFSGSAALRLLNVFKENKILGRVTWMDGMIKTLCNPKYWEKNTTLLIDGSCLSQRAHQTYFDSIKRLKVLGVFSASCKSISLFSSLSQRDKLLVLLLRSCDLPDYILIHIGILKTLKVLEISGDSHLNSLPDNLFNGMTRLQSLKLSGLHMKSLPSLSNLRELRTLILRQLSCLEEVQSLEELVKLEILDLSGASSLKSMPSNMFDEITCLQSLNLSGLQIESLPSVSKLSELRVFILNRCSRLEKLQSLKGLGKLLILDLSYATSFERFDDPTLSVLPKIQMINLSNTKIRCLPELEGLKDLTQIFLSDCCNLRNLPKLESLKSLQILDLSGAVMFETFVGGYSALADLDQLRILDLSKTKISKLYCIPPNLLELNLRGCSNLEELPSNIYQDNIQTVDFSHAPSEVV